MRAQMDLEAGRPLPVAFIPLGNDHEAAIAPSRSRETHGHSARAFTEEDCRPPMGLATPPLCDPGGGIDPSQGLEIDVCERVSQWRNPYPRYSWPKRLRAVILILTVMLQRRPEDRGGNPVGSQTDNPDEGILRRTRIRTRILLFSIVWGVLLVLVAFLLTWRARETQRELSSVVFRDLRAAASLEQVPASQYSWNDRWRAMEDGEEISVRDLADRYRSTRELVDSPDLRDVDLGSLPRLVADFDRLVGDASLRWSEASPERREEISSEMKRASDAIIGSAIDTHRRIRRNAEHGLRAVEQSTEGLMLTALGVTWMIAIVTIALARIALVKIVRPIEHLSRTATRIASQEKADERVPIAGDREIALLAHDFNRMVSALAQRDARLEELSRTDGLTGLPNFRAFEEELEKEIRSAGRRQHSFGLLVFDIDHFKKYNDQFGHLAGNEALLDFAKTIAANLREVDFAARYGGEEFVALLREIDAEPLAVTAERVRSAVEAMPAIANRISITCSIGGALYPEDGEDAASLFAAADRRLYSAKEQGRNRVVGPQAPPVAARRPA
jgi:diguanylate cyclase (GGDEF)-like protein